MEKKFHFVCYWTQCLKILLACKTDRVWALRLNEPTNELRTHSYKMFRIHETLFTLAHVYLSSWTCFQANNSHFLRLLTKYFVTLLFFFFTRSHTSCVCVCVTVSARVCVYVLMADKVRESNTSGNKKLCDEVVATHAQIKVNKWKKTKTWATTTIDAITLHELSLPEYTDDSGISESYFVYSICLHKPSMRILCSDSNDFFLLLLLEFGPLFYIMVLNCSKSVNKNEQKKKKRKKKKEKKRNNGISIEIDELKISTENYHCQLDSIQTHHFRFPCVLMATSRAINSPSWKNAYG